MSPTISMFFGVIITMRWEKGEPHHLPHLHAKYQEHKAVFSIPDGEILAGSLPRRQAKFVEGWIALHEDELLANWELAMNDQQLFRIDPLK